MNTTPKKLSIWKHLAIVWGGGIIIWPTLTALLLLPFAPSGETFTFTLIVFLLNLFTGWAFALFVFVIHWGLRGWVTTIDQFKTARQNQDQQQFYAEADYPQQPLEAPTSEQEMLAQWREMNKIGCCMEHRDADGFPSHGGPGCQHPALMS